MALPLGETGYRGGPRSEDSRVVVGAQCYRAHLFTTTTPLRDGLTESTEAGSRLDLEASCEAAVMGSGVDSTYKRRENPSHVSQ